MKPPGLARPKSGKGQFRFEVKWGSTVVAKAMDKRLADFFTLSLKRMEAIKALKDGGHSELQIALDLLFALQPNGKARKPKSK